MSDHNRKGEAMSDRIDYDIDIDGEDGEQHVTKHYDLGDDYGRCKGCESQEPNEVLSQMGGYCTSQCERESRE